MASEALVCERDGERTRLLCAECASPICPRCLVRTPVGMKCDQCGNAGRRPAPKRRRLSGLAPLGVVLLAVSILVLSRVLSSPGEPRRDPGAPAAGTLAPRGQTVRLGQPTRDGDLVMVVPAFECGATSVVGVAATRPAQGRFCFLTVAVRNVGREPAVLVQSAQMLADPLARRFGADPAATAAHPSNAGRDVGSLVVNPGNEVEAVLVYDVPPDVTPVAAALRGATASSGAVVSLTALPSR